MPVLVASDDFGYAGSDHGSIPSLASASSTSCSSDGGYEQDLSGFGVGAKLWGGCGDDTTSTSVTAEGATPFLDDSPDVNVADVCYLAAQLCDLYALDMGAAMLLVEGQGFDSAVDMCNLAAQLCDISTLDMGTALLLIGEQGYDAAVGEALLIAPRESRVNLVAHGGAATGDPPSPPPPSDNVIASVQTDPCFSFILDSAASVNVSPASDDASVMFVSTAPSAFRARVANGMTAGSSATGVAVMHVSDESYDIPFERLDGCTDRILSVPFLVSIGFTAHLDRLQSHLKTPAGTVIDVVRASSHADAMWLLPMTFDGAPGHATVAASSTTSGHLVASLVHVNAKTVGLAGMDDAVVLLNTSASPSTTASASGATATGPRPGRFHALTGPALHAALGHLTTEKFRAIRRRSIGLAKGSVIPQHARRQCRGCMLGAMSRQDIPNVAPYSTRDRYSKGERWGLDFGRDFGASIFHHSSYVILVEDQTLYVKLYFINSHTEIWGVLREFLAWCKRTFRVDVKAFKPDSDPMWTSGRAVDPDTAETKAFSEAYAVVFERSAPYTQATAIAENVQRPLLALTNTQLVHACLAAKFWEPSAINAADVLNMLPKPGSTRPLLQGDVSPHEAMFGHMPDLSRLAGAFGSLCYVRIEGAKPSQLKNTSRAALYLGIAAGSSGWKVLMLDTFSVATSLHVTIDHDLMRRPVVLLDSDSLRRDGTPGAAMADLARERSLFDGHSTSGVIVLDPLTHRPERVVEIHDAYGSSENHLTTVAGTPCSEVVCAPAPDPLDVPVPPMAPSASPLSAPAPPASSPSAPAPTSAAPAASAPASAPTSTPAPTAAATATSTATPTLPGSLVPAPPRTRRARLPDSTRISVQQANPKSGKSGARYEKYKHAKTVGQYLRDGSLADLRWDLQKGFVTVVPQAALALLDSSVLHLATMGIDAACLRVDDGAAARAPGPYPTMDVLSQSIADAVVARLDELGPPSELVASDDFDGFVAAAITANAPSASGSTISQRLSDPTGPKELLTHPRRGAYVASMVTELKQLLDVYKTLRVVPAHVVHAARAADPDHVRLFPSMWVLVSKYHADGSFNRTKGRLVACENNTKYQVPDTWSPTVSLSSVRLLLDIAAHHGAFILELDVSGAYLKGERKGDRASRARVFARLPPNLDLVRSVWDDPRLRYTDDNGNKMFFEVDSNWYGMQDAGVVWFEYFRAWVTSDEMGFTCATGDPCVYVKRSSGGFVFIATYVDDVLAVFSDLALKSAFLAAFEAKFDQSPDSGDGHNEFLGIQIKSNDDRTVLSLNTPRVFDRLQQRLDALDLPALGLVASNRRASLRAPLPPDAMELIFAPESEDNPIVPTELCHPPGLIGVAGWIVMSCRPAESFPAALLGRNARRPTRSYVQVLYHFLSYLLHTRDDELTLRGGDAMQFTTDVDSSWANCPGTQRSWFGFCMRTDGGAFMWRAKLAPSVALSSRDAEAVAAVFAVRSMLSVQILLHDLGFVTPDPLLLRVDNAATVQNTTTDLVHRDSRHMAIRLAFLREHVRRGLVNVEHVRTSLNLADIFTKILSAPEHDRIRRILMGMA